MAREYEIAKGSGCCRVCGKQLAAGQEFVAALFEQAGGFERQDFCLDCWPQRGADAPAAWSSWHSRVPLPTEPKKPVINEEVLVDFFNRLAGEQEPSKVNFRFVLGLLLMRKKSLVYDGQAKDEAGQEVWKMHFRGRDEAVEVIHPPLDDEKIADVTAQLGSLFEVQT